MSLVIIDNRQSTHVGPFGPMRVRVGIRIASTVAEGEFIIFDYHLFVVSIEIRINRIRNDTFFYNNEKKIPTKIEQNLYD